MIRLAFPLVVLSSTLLLGACSPQPSTDAASTATTAQAPSGDTQNAEAAVDAAFAEHIQPNEPGATVGVYRGGKLVYAKAYGMADVDLGVANSVDTVFNLASVSKQFAAVAIALLEKDGKLKATDDIRLYLPGMPVLETPVTVGDLVHHTSGLRDYMALGALSGHDNESLIRQPHIVQILERQRGVDFVAGTGYSYSNTGYVLMAEIVTAVSGMPFEDFLQQRIFEPLGMTHTRVRHELTDLQPGYATGYIPARGDDKGWRRAVYNRIALGPGNVLSTVGDMAKWAGNFTTPVVGDAALIEHLSAPWQLRDGTPVNYGYGLTRETVAGHAAVTHSGGISGFNTNFVYFPEQDFAVVVLANRSFPAEELTTKVAGIYLPAGSATAQAAGQAPASQATPAQPLPGLEGSYASAGGQVLTLRAAQGGFTVQALGDEPEALKFWSDGSFGAGDHDGPRYRATPGADGAVAGLEPVKVPGSTNPPAPSLSRIAPGASSAAEIAALAGSYRSDEIDATYRVTVEGGKVALHSLWLAGAQPMVETAPGRFEADAGPLRGLRFTVERGADGKPAALLFQVYELGPLRLARVQG